MYAVNTKKGVNSALQADTLSNITIKQFLDIYKQIPLFSGDLSQDVKNKLGITRKSELENLKFAKELTFEQNDRIAQTYNIEYSHNNKNPEYFNIYIYMTDKYGNLVYTHSMSSEVVLKDRLGDELTNYVIKNATEKEKTISRKEIEKYIQKIDNSNIKKKNSMIQRVHFLHRFKKRGTEK